MYNYQQNRRRRRKLLAYPAGIFSLILLPLFGLNHLMNHPALHAYTLVEVNMYYDAEKEVWLDYWTMPLPPDREFTHILMDENVLNDQVKLNYGKRLSTDIMLSGDTLSGVHYHFTDDAPYWVWMEALTSANTRYKLAHRVHMAVIPYHDDIWVFNWSPMLKRKVKAPYPPCGNTSMDCVSDRIKPKSTTIWHGQYIRYGLCFVLAVSLMVVLRMKAGN